jgi:hypothetical protein
MKAKPKRVVVISDPHCGAANGLTPPRYQTTDSEDRVWRKRARIQAAAWDWYDERVHRFARPDVLIVNGDAIDGPGERSGGVEQLTTDRRKQCEIAHACIAAWGARKIVSVGGTPYHTGQAEDWGEVLADMLSHGAEVKTGDHEWVDVNGCVFDVKHSIGGSQIPHGRFTALARDALWAQLWTDAGETPRADVLVRGHVHYHAYCGGADRPLAMTLPALQGFGTRYGARQCSGRVHFGLVVFEVDTQGRYTWHAELAKLAAHRARAWKV